MGERFLKIVVAFYGKTWQIDAVKEKKPKLVHLGCRISPQLVAKLAARALENGRSLASELRIAVLKYLETQP